MLIYGEEEVGIEYWETGKEIKMVEI